ncbi:ChrR family anti-sigma-E factor [Stella sp.]|uniref:ChrR family anti-sigma-E factor n=1 Tax=Stella sp. TaxID=2912054 RepID=UPI0035ADB38E
MKTPARHPPAQQPAQRPAQHPDVEFLLDYAAGSASDGIALLVATHVTLCPDCRGKLKAMEAVGGALLDSLAPAAVDADARARCFARLDQPGDGGTAESRPAVTAVTPAPSRDGRLPRALRDRLGTDLGSLPWQPVLRGVDQVLLDARPGGGRTRLMRIRAGQGVPRHTHRGTELVCVLEGGFSDASGHYGRGDVAVSDDSVDHRPVADADGDCICLAVTEAPVRLTGRLWRLLNPFVRF